MKNRVRMIQSKARVWSSTAACFGARKQKGRRTCSTHADVFEVRGDILFVVVIMQAVALGRRTTGIILSQSLYSTYFWLLKISVMLDFIHKSTDMKFHFEICNLRTDLRARSLQNVMCPGIVY